MEKEKEAEMREGNISLILDSYNDIFSDFDPRPYSERSISDDFLRECKNAARHKGEKVELRLLVPRQKRISEDELKIKKRLKNHFQNHFNEEHIELKKTRITGLIWAFIGFLLMAAATFLYKRQELVFNFLFIITEPAGWFMFWEGLVKALIDPQEKIPNYHFYRKMRNVTIVFLSY